jgi:hypothetical protein
MAVFNLWITLAVVAAVPLRAASIASPVTFRKDVLPVLQKNCQACRRSGDTGPMPFLLTHKESRPVLTKKMPPWFADPHYGKFSNSQAMSQPKIDALVAWANSRALEGDPKDAPAPARFTDGWGRSKPRPRQRCESGERWGRRFRLPSAAHGAAPLGRAMPCPTCLAGLRLFHQEM